MKCWQVSYYFTHKSRRREYRGSVCGCVRAATRAEAIRSSDITQADMSEDNHLTRVTAFQKSENHICSESEAA